MYNRMYACPRLDKAGKYTACGSSLGKPSLGIPATDLATVHCPGQDLTKLASNLAQEMVAVFYSSGN